ncbi:MAG: hypothetical protein HYX77_07365 [Acidobacteria bacterium]|nr:hypothetical protein [Acidobacteriota bacterium]
MLKRDRNRLLEIISKSGFEPRDFQATWEGPQRERSFVVQFRNTPFRFSVHADSQKYFCGTFTIYKARYPEGFPEPGFGNMPVGVTISGVEMKFEQWLSDIESYLEDQETIANEQMTPDLWASFEKAVGDSEHRQALLENTPFSAEEQARITRSLGEFAHRVRQEGFLSVEHFDLLQEKLDHLIELSERPGLGRRDWLAAAAGALISFVIQSALTSDSAISATRSCSVRDALRAGDVKRASQFASRVFRLTPVQV